MTSARILIADDEESIRLVLQRILQKEGYQVETARDGAEALEMLARGEYDVLLLDLNMKPIDGLRVLRKAHEKDKEMIVIILTGHGSLESAVEALRLGAFDYLTEPAIPDAIRQRVAAGVQHRRQVLQRNRLLEQIEALKETLETLDVEINKSARTDAERFLRSGPLTMDLYHRSASLGETPLDLTTAEFDILVCLVKASPQPLSPVEIVQCALGYETYPVEARELVKWHIHRLRRKMEPEPTRPRYIKTVRGRGYLWTV